MKDTKAWAAVAGGGVLWTYSRSDVVLATIAAGNELDRSLIVDPEPTTCETVVIVSAERYAELRAHEEAGRQAVETEAKG